MPMRVRFFKSPLTSFHQFVGFYQNLKTGIPRVLFLKSQKYCNTVQMGKLPHPNTN